MIGCGAAAALNGGAGACTGFCWCNLFCYGFCDAHLCSVYRYGLVLLGIVSSRHVHASEGGGSEQWLITKPQLSTLVPISPDVTSMH